MWAGNEACEPVTWRECKLVPRQVDFKVPKVDCVEGDPIPYTDCEDAEKIQMTTRSGDDHAPRQTVQELKLILLSG